MDPLNLNPVNADLLNTNTPIIDLLNVDTPNVDLSRLDILNIDLNTDSPTSNPRFFPTNSKIRWQSYEDQKEKQKRSVLVLF